MRNVICCWCESTAERFEHSLPLLFSGIRNAERGYKNGIDLLFLDGYDRLPNDYTDALRDAGYHLQDVSALYAEVKRDLSALHRFNSYEHKCFLRWPVLSKFYLGEPIIHYDGDILFNEDPAVIGGLLNGKTFVLQGCPALTCISDATWHVQYVEQLQLLNNNIEGYSLHAWNERSGWEISDKQKWAGQRYRPIISSDQDLISHLIHTNRLMQDRPHDIMASLGPYMVFENPLYIHAYGFLDAHAPFRYERRSNTDYLNGKRVLIWHMQGDFTQYLRHYIFRSRYLPIHFGRLANHLEGKDNEYYVHKVLQAVLPLGKWSRLAVYQYFFQNHDLSGVLNNTTWWKEDVFL